MNSYLELPEFKNSQLLKEGVSKKDIPEKFKQIKIKAKTTFHVVIEKDEDFYNVLESLRYHMTDEVPFEVYDYFVHHPDLNMEEFKDYYYKDFETLKTTINSEIDERTKYSVYKYRRRKVKNVYDKIKAYLLYDSSDDISLSLIKYLVEKIHFQFDPMILEAIAEETNDKLEIIKYLFDKGYKLNGVIFCDHTTYDKEWNVTDVCLSKKKFKYLEFALDNGCQVTHLDTIYENDDDEMLKYIIDNGFDTTGYIKYINRKNKHLGLVFEFTLSYHACEKCIKYFIDNGFVEKEKMISTVHKTINDKTFGDRPEKNTKLKQIVKNIE